MFSEIEFFPVEYPILQRASSEILQRCSDTENLKVSMKTFKAHQKTMRTFDNTWMHAEGVIKSWRISELIKIYWKCLHEFISSKEILLFNYSLFVKSTPERVSTAAVCWGHRRAFHHPPQRLSRPGWRSYCGGSAAPHPERLTGSHRKWILCVTWMDHSQQHCSTWWVMHWSECQVRCEWWMYRSFIRKLISVFRIR